LLFIPTYFAPIIQYVALIKNGNIVFEVEDNYQKQTYRNRCNIYTASGKLQLNIPIVNKKNVRQKTKDIKIDNNYNWQTQHFRTLQNSYRSSPYYEFYEDELRPLFEQKQKFLLDFNIKCHEFIINAIQEDITYSKTSIYNIESDLKDFRNLAISRKELNYNLKPYTQIFENKHGFISNLSILDLLFMEGPSTETYLKNNYTSDLFN
jgi:hypothetical protein